MAPAATSPSPLLPIRAYHLRPYSFLCRPLPLPAIHSGNCPYQNALLLYRTAEQNPKRCTSNTKPLYGMEKTPVRQT